MLKILLISIIYFIPQTYAGKKESAGPKALKLIFGSKKLTKKILSGTIVAVSNVNGQTKGKESRQHLKLSGAGYHTKSCRFALRKLSLYENYKNYVGVIKESSYQEQKKRVMFKIESGLLPFTMRLNFKLPRIKTPGIYPFSFDRGFLKGLLGKIHVYEYKKKCLFIMTSEFKGPHTGINNYLLEFFSHALTKLTLSNLIRISKTF